MLFFQLNKELKFFYDWKYKEMVFAKQIVPAKDFIQFTKTSTKHDVEHQDQL